jgi:GNAT superfamily N-acetyltransferase
MPQIRELNWRKHGTRVLEFQREVYETNFPGFVADPLFLRRYADELRRSASHPSEGLFVLEDDGEAVGFLWVSLITTLVDPCVGYIKNIFVAEHLRGEGHGRRLVSFAEHWCRTRGVYRIALDASCCNQRAVGLYAQMGYGTVRYRMEKQLAPSEQGGDPPTRH